MATNHQSDVYIPTARDAVIGRFGRNAARNLRAHCNACLDEHPLTDSSPIYGDLQPPAGPAFMAEHEPSCEVCGITFLSLSESCQREHDEQQYQWSRTSATHVLIEYGIPAMIRCRVY